MKTEHRWIRDDIEIDFPVPKEIQYIIEQLEKMDEEENYGFFNFSESLIYSTRNCYNDKKITKKQWDILCQKYSSIS